MLFRYRARNYPDSLSEAERADWDEFRTQRLIDPAGGASIVLDDYLALIETLGADPACDERRQRLLGELMAYAEAIVPG